MKRHLNTSRNQQHPFHLVDPSPWPFYISVSLLHILLYLVMKIESGFSICTFLLLACHSYGFILAIVRWFNDIIVEGTFEGQHTKRVQQGLYLGMLLFIISEVMFFFSFFWSFFYLSLNPSTELGGVWPPEYIQAISPTSLPLLNTLLLLASGISITYCHRLMIYGNNHRLVSNSLLITILWGILFTEVQIFEYIEASFSIRDGAYGSIFYMCTGFHGFHVFVGTLFLLVCLLRQYKFHFTKEQHVGFEAAAWYWHFVDVVWLFLFVCIYWWGF